MASRPQDRKASRRGALMVAAKLWKWLKQWTARPRDLESIVMERKRRWEQNWQVESRRPVAQLATTVPLELKDAVRDGWIASGSSVMDIGSGRGQIGAWLAQQGFGVLGADLAESATELARRHFSDVGPHLQFKTMNICLDPPEPDRFDAFVDRGCFHGVPRELKRRYVENVATWAKPGARLLLFHKVDDGGSTDADMGALQQTLERHVRSTFEPYFAIDRACAAAEPLARSAGPIPRKVKPGMVFWMVRR
jgi:SAM-dependent methyltransferase